MVLCEAEGSLTLLKSTMHQLLSAERKFLYSIACDTNSPTVPKPDIARHTGPRFSADTANNFLSIYGSLGDLSEKFILGVSTGLVVKVQY